MYISDFAAKKIQGKHSQERPSLCSVIRGIVVVCRLHKTVDHEIEVGVAKKLQGFFPTSLAEALFRHEHMAFDDRAPTFNLT